MIMLTKKLQEVLTPSELMISEPLSAHTTFKIGGPADIFVEPNSPEKLSRVMQLISEYKAPITILGSGSNVLVRDGGIRGVVLSLCQLRHVKRRDETTLVMGAGFMLKEASEYAWQEGLSGMEFAIGIPGSLGGAVFMNAGAYDGEMSQVVTRVTAVDRNGEFHTYSGEECRFAYRHSLFQDNHEVVAEVEMTLVPGDAKVIKAVMDDLTERRESKQPLEHASAGSTFKRPPGYFAGTLIEQTGLKGLAVGDAMVSQKHAGFVVNVGTAKAKDVLAVIHEVQRRVKEAHGVDLETEVRLIGEDE